MSSTSFAVTPCSSLYEVRRIPMILPAVNEVIAENEVSEHSKKPEAKKECFLFCKASKNYKIHEKK